MILQNGEYFGIVRQLADPYDNGTYYVRAEIRDASSDELLERVTLVDRGSRRFSVPWLVNAKRDGAYISIMTAVYTDAAFTTPSDAYAQEIQTYLVETRNLGGGGSGGGGIGEKRMTELLVEVIKELKPKDMNLEKILEGLTDRFAKRVESEGKQNREVLGKQIAEIEVKPEVKVTTDLKPVLEAIGDINTKAEERMEGAVGSLTELFERLQGSVDKAIEELGDLNTDGKSALSTIRDEIMGSVQEIKEAMAAGATASAAAIRGTTVDLDDVLPPREPQKTPAQLIRELRQGTKA